MKTYRLLFSAPMARAVVEGRKTVTRRFDRRLLNAKPGDLLLGKETFAVVNASDAIPPRNLRAENTRVWYLADGAKPSWVGKTRVSIHMPDWAVRIRARIVSVREEALHDITEEDAKAEGVKFTPPLSPGSIGYRRAFARLWDSINGDGSWATNPSVVRVEFAPEVTRG